MKNKIACMVIILSFSSLVLTGCIDDGSVIYESHPNKIKYTITYGYDIICIGGGKYNIFYNCDMPDQFLNTIILSNDLLYKDEYRQDNFEGNQIIRWNINGSSSDAYKLGMTAEILGEGFIVSDLNGDYALKLGEIKSDYPDVYENYTKKQSADGIDYIDPENAKIKEISTKIMDECSSNNSFIVAKKIFIWLKENTEYVPHETNNKVQTAYDTCILESGDCDDLSFLYISLCRAVGLPARFIRGYLVEEAGTVAHAWTEVFVGKDTTSNDGWIPVECAGISNDVESEINQNFGVERAGHLRLYEDSGTDESLNFSISGPYVKYDKGVDIQMTGFVNVQNYEVLESKELFVDKNGKRQNR